MQREGKLTVNVKATTEFTIETVKVDFDKRSVGELVHDVLKMDKDLNYDNVQVTSGRSNDGIDFKTKINTFPDGTVLDISK